MKTLFVVNPASGGGRTGRIQGDLQRVIERRLGKCDFVFTERVGHGIELAEKAARDGYELVVATGGDGTMNECATGLVRATARDVARDAVRLGILPQGTGGDFRRTLGLPHRLDAYLDTLAAGKTRALDVGHVKFPSAGKDAAPDRSEADREMRPEKVDRTFVNIVSVGMSGLVDVEVANTSKALGGTVAYFAASLKALTRAQPARFLVTWEYDGKKQEREVHTYVLAIANAQYFGSQMHCAPMADPFDGQFEIVSFGPTTKTELVLSSRDVYSGKHLQHPNAWHTPAQNVSVTLLNDSARDVVLVDCDGEALYGPPFSVTMDRGRLLLVAP